MAPSGYQPILRPERKASQLSLLGGRSFDSEVAQGTSYNPKEDVELFKLEYGE